MILQIVLALNIHISQFGSKSFRKPKSWHCWIEVWLFSPMHVSMNVKETWRRFLRLEDPPTLRIAFKIDMFNKIFSPKTRSFWISSAGVLMIYGTIFNVVSCASSAIENTDWGIHDTHRLLERNSPSFLIPFLCWFCEPRLAGVFHRITSRYDISLTV